MTPSEPKPSPDFFEAPTIDPLAAATGTRKGKTVAKKKAGFYLSEALLARFNHHYHQMKLDGVPIENKSALLESALAFALDDLDKGKKSRILTALVRRSGSMI